MIYKISQATNSASALLFAEGPDPRSLGSSVNLLQNQWNEGGWSESPTAGDSYDGRANTWGDLVATWHRGGSNFTFVDGHAESWHYFDKRTLWLYNGNPNWPSLVVRVNNLDLTRIRTQIMTWSQSSARLNSISLF